MVQLMIHWREEFPVVVLACELDDMPTAVVTVSMKAMRSR